MWTRFFNLKSENDAGIMKIENLWIYYKLCNGDLHSHCQFIFDFDGRDLLPHLTD